MHLETKKTDVVIVGGGPGGAAAAIYLARRGINSVIVEKDDMPRYHIGESMTGEVGQRVRELGLGDWMMESRHPHKFGVRVYGAEAKNSFLVPVMERDEEGQLKAGQTWQVRRDLFDKRLLEEALSNGAELVKAKATDVIVEGDGIRGVRVRHDDGHEAEISARVVIDASGLAAFLSSAGVAGKRVRGDYDNQIAVYSQIRGALRDDEECPDNTQILYSKKNHWAWFIPLDDEVVSVGIVTPTEYFKGRGETREEFFLRELHELHPELKRRVPVKDLAEDVKVSANYSYEIKDFVGNGYLCIGDSHRFIDPIFSFGLHFAIHEAEKAADAIAAHFASNEPMSDTTFAEFKRVSNLGMDKIQALIDAFWNSPLGFAHVAHARNREDLIDLFAGRVYAEQPSAGLIDILKINEANRAKMAAKASAG